MKASVKTLSHFTPGRISAVTTMCVRSVQCTMWTAHSVHCALFTLKAVYSTLFTVPSESSVQYILFTLRAVYSTLFTEQCTVYSTQTVLCVSRVSQGGKFTGFVPSSVSMMLVSDKNPLRSSKKDWVFGEGFWISLVSGISLCPGDPWYPGGGFLYILLKFLVFLEILGIPCYNGILGILIILGIPEIHGTLFNSCNFGNCGICGCLLLRDSLSMDFF